MMKLEQSTPMSRNLSFTSRRRNPVRTGSLVVARHGFTLIEMLISVTLVLLMMSMFAQIFQIAGASISKQRGLAENDQRSRTLQTIIKADLDKRSFRWVYPFAPTERAAAPSSNIGNRQGYFYISENNPYSKTDDVIQFTVVSTITTRNKDESPYYGRAQNLGAFTNLPNQPDSDDAQLSANNTGLSTVAEIVYFVRNGNLYRRQLLVREPLSVINADAQPRNGSGQDLFDPNAAAVYSPTGPFWADFDYSAYYDLNPSNKPSAHFLGSDHLDNSGTNIALGKPQYRFGFSPPVMSAGNAGRPKEFGSDGVGAPFIGRFTMQECSDLGFRYPQNKTANGNIPTDPTLVLSVDASGTVNSPDDFTVQPGARRGEDLLMSNVHAFDIQVWDTGFGGFVDIGDPRLTGTRADFQIGNRLNSSYGPHLTENFPTVVNACFDTWHPAINIDGFAGFDNPPFHPVIRNPAVTPAWSAGATGFNVGSEIFPTATQNPAGSPFFYRCIAAADLNNDMSIKSGAFEPSWPTAESLTVTDNELVWQAVENRRALKAIKFEIRFVDPSTQQMRQLTLIQSLVD